MRSGEGSGGELVLVSTPVPATYPGYALWLPPVASFLLVLAAAFQVAVHARAGDEVPDLIVAALVVLTVVFVASVVLAVHGVVRPAHLRFGRAGVVATPSRWQSWHRSWQVPWAAVTAVRPDADRAGHELLAVDVDGRWWQQAGGTWPVFRGGRGPDDPGGGSGSPGGQTLLLRVAGMPLGEAMARIHRHAPPPGGA